MGTATEQLIVQAEAARRACEAAVIRAEALLCAGLPVPAALLAEMSALQAALTVKVAEMNEAMGIRPDEWRDTFGSFDQQPLQ